MEACGCHISNIAGGISHLLLHLTLHIGSSALRCSSHIGGIAGGVSHLLLHLALHINSRALGGRGHVGGVAGRVCRLLLHLALHIGGRALGGGSHVGGVAGRVCCRTCKLRRGEDHLAGRCLQGLHRHCIDRLGRHACGKGAWFAAV